MNTRKKKTIVFAVAGYNLAETSRMIEIARETRRAFDVLFLSYGGQFESLIKEEGFELHEMSPRLTEKKLKHVRKALNGETFITVGYFNYNDLVPRVENEIEFFNKLKPAAVLTGWCLSVPVSAHAAGIPFVNVLHSTSVKEYYRAGLQTWPDRLSYGWLKKLFGEKRLNARINRRILNIKFVVRSYNKIGKKYGLNPFNSFIDMIEGDYTLLADIPEWVGFEKVRPNVRYIGSLPARINREVPDEFKNLPKDKPVIYFAMGSSGKPELIKQIIEGFTGKPYTVIAPVRSLVERMMITVPENVKVTGFVPAHRVNPMADISVIHGGQNTVMQACLSGTPFVGIGMHPEQEANIEACVRKGFAIRLNKWRDKAEDVLKAVDGLLQDETAKQKVLEFKEQLEKWEGPVNAAAFLREVFGKVSGSGIHEYNKKDMVSMKGVQNED